MLDWGTYPTAGPGGTAVLGQRQTAPSWRKTWEVETTGFGPDAETFEQIEADQVIYGNGLIEFIINGEVVALFNLDSVVAVRTVA